MAKHSFVIIAFMVCAASCFAISATAALWPNWLHSSKKSNIGSLNSWRSLQKGLSMNQVAALTGNPNHIHSNPAPYPGESWQFEHKGEYGFNYCHFDKNGNLSSWSYDF